MLTTPTTVTDAEWPRIYNLMTRAVDNEVAAEAAALAGEKTSSTALDLESAVEMVIELYGIDALRQLLTGRSPRA
ncbi:hypothetical protein AB0D10_05230 [Kitasatospora sp. NPDC048545]|uniref:hypothetical protein n=1 Tax=Kitasatospora sp. NPDC048545 TaxID=3157208 RepID=UPI0033DE97B2